MYARITLWLGLPLLLSAAACTTVSSGGVTPTQERQPAAAPPRSAEASADPQPAPAAAPVASADVAPPPPPAAPPPAAPPPPAAAPKATKAATAEPSGSCKRYLCGTGEHCAVTGGRATCVADSQSVCPTVRCDAAQPHCVEWAATGEHACLRRDECHRDSDCGDRRCQPEATCVRAPCFQPLVCQ